MKLRNFISTTIRESLNEEQMSNALKKYDVVMTLSPEPNGFHGAGVVEYLDGEYAHISSLRTWIVALKNNHSDWMRNNTISIHIDNAAKVTPDNLNKLSIAARESYDTYIHLWKTYLDREQQLNENLGEEFKVGDYVTFRAHNDGIPSGGISFGEIIEINGNYGRVVTGGIDLNRTNHHRPNYMIPIRVRPINSNDTIYKVTLSTLSHIDKTIWGR